MIFDMFIFLRFEFITFEYFHCAFFSPAFRLENAEIVDFINCFSFHKLSMELSYMSHFDCPLMRAWRER